MHSEAMLFTCQVELQVPSPGVGLVQDAFYRRLRCWTSISGTGIYRTMLSKACYLEKADIQG